MSATEDKRVLTPDADDARFRAWNDRGPEGETDGADVEVGDAEAGDDRAVPRAEALGDLKATLFLLRAQPEITAPPDFLASVQTRIRRRTHGRFYGTKQRWRLPIEAVLNIVLLGVMFMVYIAAQPKAAPVAPMVQATPELSREIVMGAALLGTYGMVEVVAGSQTGGGLTVRVLMAPDRLAGLDEELGLYPQLDRVTPGEAVAGTNDIAVLVRVRPR